MYKPKICLIGPFPPYKGGISQYNDCLAEELSNNSELYCISYKRQYPGFLIKNRVQKDNSSRTVARSYCVDFLIDSVNPFSYLKSIYRLVRFKPDLVIIPWWVIYWAPLYLIIFVFLKLFKIKSLAICHNVFEHEDNSIKQLVSKFVLKFPDNYIVHSNGEMDKIISFTKNKNIIKHLLPIYDHMIVEEEKYDSVIGSPLRLLFFGFVRQYKGLDLLLSAVNEMQNDVVLTIAGEFWEGREEYFKYISDNNLKNIKIMEGYVSDDLMDQVFRSNDIVVLPYKSATGSAVLSTAYAYSKPVLVTNVGGLPDAVVNYETGIVVEANQRAIMKGLKFFMEEGSRIDFSNNIKRFVAENMSWKSLAHEVLSCVK